MNIPLKLCTDDVFQELELFIVVIGVPANVLSKVSCPVKSGTSTTVDRDN
jgi:hypothetical protein